ncbi:MAG: HDOD domain-containing protein [Thermodesulfobacteriota bacterium]
MSPSELLRRIEAGYELPSLSPVAMQLVEIALAETCSAEDLADIIEQDPALAVRLLRVANSAFFKTAVPTTSLRQAVVKLGFQRLRIMALSLSLRDTFPMGTIGVLDYRHFWHITLYRALIAKSLAAKVAGCSPEEAFAAGMIMEIGLLILFDLQINADFEALPIELEPLEELLMWERDRYGIDHRQVGKAALACWKFPEHIVQCQLLYGEAALAEGSPILAKIYELSRGLSGLMSGGNSGFQAPFYEADELFGLNEDVVNGILLATFEQVEEIAKSLDLEVNKERDLMEIMEKANSALARISDKMAEFQRNPHHLPPPSFDSLPEEQDIVDHTLQSVAHEIRNPLLVVGGFARRLAVALDPASEGGEYVRIILKEASRLEDALSKMILKREWMKQSRADAGSSK